MRKEDELNKKLSSKDKIKLEKFEDIVARTMAKTEFRPLTARRNKDGKLEGIKEDSSWNFIHQEDVYASMEEIRTLLLNVLTDDEYSTIQDS